MAEEKKDLFPVDSVVSIEAVKGKPVPWRYRHFIEGVAAEEIAASRGADRERIVRAFRKSDPETGKNEVHIVGSQEAVDDVAEGISKPGREVHKWYMGEAEDAEAEAKAVRPALQELIRDAPQPVVGDPLKFVEEALKLPLGSEEAKPLEQGRVEDAAKALKEFSKGGD